MVDAKGTGDGIIEGNHDGHDENGGDEALHTGADQDDEVQLETQEDDAGPEKFIGNEARAFPGRQRDRTADLDSHTQQQGQDQVTDEGKARQGSQRLAGQGTGQGQDDAEQGVAPVDHSG